VYEEETDRELMIYNKIRLPRMNKMAKSERNVGGKKENNEPLFSTNQ
jgi:hypothetical protein